MSTEGKGSEQVEVTDGTDLGSGWKTVLFNCSCHSFDQVEKSLIKATGCALGKARSIATTIHNKGSAVVAEGSAVECENVAIALEADGLQVKVQK